MSQKLGLLAAPISERHFLKPPILSDYQAFLLAQWMRGELDYYDDAVMGLLASLDDRVNEMLLDMWFQANDAQAEED
jgi:hypothetical protein